MIWMIFFVIVGCIFISIYILYKKDFDTSNVVFQQAIYEVLFFVVIPSTIIFSLSLLWPIHVWKTHLPLRFSRKTRKVYFHLKGKTYVEEWDEIKASLKVQHGINAMGAPLMEPQINFEFFDDEGKLMLTTFVMGTERIGLTSNQKAAVFWEYIRRYMEDGVEQLPTPNVSDAFKYADLSELRRQYKLFPLWYADASISTKFFNLVLLPFYLAWDAISYPTEILYYYLEKYVKTNPFPPEMDEPCRCEDEVVIWHPKMRLEQRKHDPAEQTKKRIPIIR
jgi:hypothetical protein